MHKEWISPHKVKEAHGQLIDRTFGGEVEPEKVLPGSGLGEGAAEAGTDDIKVDM